MYEPLLGAGLKNAKISILEPSHAKQVWNVDDYLKVVPKAFVKSWRAHLVQFYEPLLPEGGIGIDTGVNMGLAFIMSEDVAFTLGLTLNRKPFDSVQVMRFINNIPTVFPDRLPKKTPVLVEGAAYGAKGQQALLGQIRAALLLGFDQNGFETVIEMPPLSIRKRCFGSAKIKALDFWENDRSMRPVWKSHEADALSMAIVAGI